MAVRGESKLGNTFQDQGVIGKILPDGASVPQKIMVTIDKWNLVEFL